MYKSKNKWHIALSYVQKSPEQFLLLKLLLRNSFQFFRKKISLILGRKQFRKNVNRTPRVQTGSLTLIVSISDVDFNF